MNKQNQQKFPLVAALLASKVLKEIKSRDEVLSGLIYVAGHQSMKIYMDALTDRLHIMVTGTDKEFEMADEPRALIRFFALTFEATDDYAAGYLASKSPALRLAITGK